ncbi:unnamed protein product [Somion occarium]|uniref:Polyketide synthase-like phosphopantetheine-binding domain-containing protein n=1 Tax=Somion occarium TaxID=3059160 RepID=A0ABP1D6W0_9APHY
MSDDRPYPPLDGTITVLPGFVDFQAEHHPTLPWAIFPSIENPQEPTIITFEEFTRATHRIAHALRPQRSGQDGEIVALAIHCDTILYVATMIGLIRAGLPFPMSVRNSPEAICSMLENSSCHRVITQPFLVPLVSAVQAQLAAKNFTLKIDDLPDVHSIFPTIRPNAPAAVDVPAYPPSDRKPEPNDVLLYLHSSGSTGHPRPVPQTQKIMLQWAGSPVILANRGRDLRLGSMMAPTFHTTGLYMQVLPPIVNGDPIATFTPQGPSPPVMPNPRNTLEAAKLTRCNGVAAIPAFLEVWAQSPEDIEYLASLILLSFAGGPLSDAGGAKLQAAGCKLFSVYGATEFGAPTGIFDTDDSQGLDAPVKTSADYAWFQFPDYVNMRWIDQGDGTYELQFLTCDTHQPAVENLPDVKGYATSDLFESHPTKPGLWRVVGRTDDVLVLATGEKIVPLPQEGYIGSVPEVAGSVMFGRGKNQAGILIEPRPELQIDPTDGEALVAFRNRIWPHIEEANKLGPAFARIFKETIIVTDPARPLPRAAKGTVQRKRALALYAEDIEALYEKIEASANANGIAPPASWTVEDVERWLSRHAASLNHDQTPESDVDVFEQGFDSLNATLLRNRVIGALRSSTDPSAQKAAIHVPQDFVYHYPTIQRLAVAIVNLVSPTAQSNANAHTANIQEFIDKYSANLPTKPISSLGKQTDKGSEGLVVLLTGSTGSLGSHILAALLEEPKVSRIYALNRGEDVSGRQKLSFEDKKLATELLDSTKLVQLSSDLSRTDLGLSAETLKEIKTSVTHIIHNAWRVEFNLSLSSFESYIASTRNLLDVSSQFAHHIRFFFTSSISVAVGWNASKGEVPEDVIDNIQALSQGAGGYESSKYVVEHILAKASRAGAVTATSLRVGQVSGSTKTGAWNTSEWVPSIVKSSVALGCLPALEGVVSWIPMDTTARTIVEVVLSPSPLPPVLNVVNPRPVPWNQVFKDISQSISQDGPSIPIVPFEDWLTKLEALSSNVTAKDLADTPAIKLLRFLRSLSPTVPTASSEAGGLPTFSTKKTQDISTALRTNLLIDKEQVESWIAFWKERSFI